MLSKLIDLIAKSLFDRNPGETLFDHNNVRQLFKMFGENFV